MKSNEEVEPETDDCCPACGGNDIDYKAAEFEENQVYFPFECENCGKTGKQWFKLTFIENTIDE